MQLMVASVLVSPTLRQNRSSTARVHVAKVQTLLFLCSEGPNLIIIIISATWIVTRQS